MLLLSFAPVLLITEGQAQNERHSTVPQPVAGVEIFRQHCAACHGFDGKGYGPVSPALKHAVPDLTHISQRNGGKFPGQWVKEIVDGTGPRLVAHGARKMPTWGPVFHQIEWDQDLGNVRMEAITKYLESLQVK